MYGKFHHDTYEFHKELHNLFSNFFEKHPELEIDLHNEITDLRNKVIALLNSWIGAKKLEIKFGVKIPLNSTPPSLNSFFEKQARSFQLKYRRCEVCGEGRITHFCHIIPRADGGPNDDENYLYLCPIHHHLFDHHRINKEEWAKIDFSKKSESSREYVNKVMLPKLQRFWETK